MNKTYILRKTHRWMGLLIGIQLLFWILGGLYFSIIPIENIRGEHLVTRAEPNFQSLPGTMITAHDAYAAALGNEPGLKVENIELIQLMDAWHYRIEGKVAEADTIQLVDAVSGTPINPIDQATAEVVLLSMLNEDYEIRSSELVTSTEPGSEYRDKALPAWRITTQYPRIATFYIAQQTGELTAVRTDAWRFFDFLWMLHIMDYDNRDDFNHGFLTLMASLALITVLSGFLLWLVTTRRFGRTA